MSRWLRWLRPGLEVKRWVILFGFSLLLFILGVAYVLREFYSTAPLPGFFYYLTLQFFPYWIRALLFGAIGIGLFVVMTTWWRGRHELSKTMETGTMPDELFLTDDNPRTENPAAIRAAVAAGAAQVPGATWHEVGGGRAEAIAAAVAAAGPHDIVAVLGKGHEQGQDVAGRVLPFDDRVVLAEALTARFGEGS